MKIFERTVQWLTVGVVIIIFYFGLVGVVEWIATQIT